METLFKLASSAGDVIKGSADKACSGTCGGSTIEQIFNSATNALLFLIGAVSVIFIIIGGLRYITSNGDSKNVEAAKNTILYAVIGLIVAIAAYAIVQFVGSQF